MTGVAVRHLVRNMAVPSGEPRPTIQLEDVLPGAARLAGPLTVQEYSGQNAFEPGDVLFSKLRPYLAKSFQVTSPLQGSGEFLCLRPSADIHSRFLLYVTMGHGWVEHSMLSSYGAKMPRTSWEQMASFEIPLPPLDEQRRIADFLDERVALIDQIIAARRSQVSLMQQRLRSEVAEVVVGSGPGWLEGPLRRFVTSEDRLRIPLSTEERSGRSGPYPYYGASGVIDHVDQYLFEGPRVLVSEDGANLLARSTPIAFVANGQYWVNNHAHILQPVDGEHDFWAARIEALDVSPWVTGSAQPKLTIDATLALPVSVPSDASVIASFGREVRSAKMAMERHKSGMERGVTLLQEYKQSLITAAVTGELDVTTASTRIPENLA